MNKHISTLLFQVMFLVSSLGINGQTFIVVTDIPDNTPEGDNIFIAGDFNGWDSGGSNYVMQYDTTQDFYIIALDSTVTNIQYKFTRGSWTSVESDINGNFVANRTNDLSQTDSIFVQIAGWEDLSGQSSGSSTAADNVMIYDDQFYMGTLDRNRRIWIYLPPDYDLSSTHYPVIYMHDGQNLFDASTSFISEWSIDETLNELHLKGDPGVIVVGIDNGQNLRTDEYAPFENPNYGGGEGDAYIRFIIEDLKPLIDNEFRTLPNPENTGLIGSSLGGLISTYGGLKYPETFGKIGAFSPAYWFNPEVVELSFIDTVPSNIKLYQFAGALEGAAFVRDMAKVEGNLKALGMKNEQITSIEHADGEHSEWYWKREFEDAYLWLFRNETSSTQNVRSNLEHLKVYPNPTEGVVRVDFYLNWSADIYLDLLDAGSSKLNALLGERLESGVHQLQFDIKDLNLPSGQYYIRMISANGSKAYPFIVK